MLVYVKRVCLRAHVGLRECAMYSCLGVYFGERLDTINLCRAPLMSFLLLQESVHATLGKFGKLDFPFHFSPTFKLKTIFSS